MHWFKDLKTSRRLREFLSAGLVIVATLGLLVSKVWVFGPLSSRGNADSLWQLLLDDRATRGFVRALGAVAALYGLASIAVLAMRGRWLRQISASGIEVEAAESDATVARLERDLEIVRRERDEARRLARQVSDG